MSHKFYLGDDGTLDTVLVCEDCGAERRYTFMPDSDEDTYADFVAWAFEDAEEEHICGEDE